MLLTLCYAVFGFLWWFTLVLLGTKWEKFIKNTFPYEKFNIERGGIKDVILTFIVPIMLYTYLWAYIIGTILDLLGIQLW